MIDPASWLPCDKYRLSESESSLLEQALGSESVGVYSSSNYIVDQYVKEVW